jgi:carbon monoxide dehydrogenase subunit G
MAKVESSTELPVTADAVWNLVGRFNGLPEWHPAISASEVEGEGDTKVRKLTLMDGSTITERLEESDEEGRSYTYSIVSGPLPVANYTATIRVRPVNHGCRVTWSSDFEASGASESEAMQVIRGVYEAGFENLKKLFGV